MPRYEVKEKRCYNVTYIVEADDEDAAIELDGDILDEIEGESWAAEFTSVEALDA